jgi:hypothetical protein
MLKRCSEKRDLTEWNEWREAHPSENIWLQGGNFRGWFLKGVRLDSGESIDINGHTHKFICEVHLEGADFFATNLDGAYLWEAHLERANFAVASIKCANFDKTFLQRANFYQAVVDGETSIWKCKVSRKTNFSGVGLDSIRIEPATKQLLKYNIRRMNWEDWYREHKILRWPIWLFWLMNDYGNSTWRIIWCFFGVAAVFAVIYYFVLGLTANLHVEGSRFLNIVRACYFSVITMVTGFEDINPNDKSIAGHILLAVQVVLGYVLLGALVARLAVLFTGEGPAGKFADENRKEDADKGGDGVS